MAELVSIVFLLQEEVTPRIFASRVFEACASAYAIREGEGVITSDGFMRMVPEEES